MQQHSNNRRRELQLKLGFLGRYQKKKRVLGFKFLGFLGDGFGVKEKNKKAGTSGLCPIVTGTH
jgi:hypothetical protein